MKKNLIYYLFAIFILSCQTKDQPEKQIENKKRITSELDSLMNPDHFPFYHGVASGDPLPNSVIIWTRVTPKFHDKITVDYEISEDPELKNIIQKGSFETDSSRDYTVKIDIQKLNPGTTYYYRFYALNEKSPVGRTKTIGINPEKIKLGFASCSNYAWGYFNAYRLMGEDSLDAVIHLGDYIYEHAPGTYEGHIKGRAHLPAKEIITLEDYRTRYSQYRLDEDLQFAHAQHPFITIWDDHELANNAYEDGAQNHNEGEGEWNERLAIAKKVYYEWMPIRENEGKHYRSFSFGDLANLIMIDTRTDGRSKQPEDVYLNDLDSSRHIMNRGQMIWLKTELNKKHTWNVIGNQILFSNLTVFFSSTGQLYDDGWSGYKRDQMELSEMIKDMKNNIFVTGDFHSSFAINNKRIHDCNMIGFHEFVVPSITSANYDEDYGKDSALIYSKWYQERNENIGYVNLIDHGYFVLELSKAACFAHYIFCKDIKSKNREIKQGPTYGFRSFSFMD